MVTEKLLGPVGNGTTVIVQLDATPDTLNFEVNLNEVSSKKGFRVTSISAFGTADNPQFAVIWSHRPSAPSQRFRFADSSFMQLEDVPWSPTFQGAALQWRSSKYFDDAPKGYAPALVAMKGPPSAAFGCVVYEQLAFDPIASMVESLVIERPGRAPQLMFFAADGDKKLDAKKLVNTVDFLGAPARTMQEAATRRPVYIASASLLGDPAGNWVAAVTRPQQSGNILCWNCTTATDVTRFADDNAIMEKGWARAATFDFADDGSLVALWYDDSIGPYQGPVLHYESKESLLLLLDLMQGVFDTVPYQIAARNRPKTTEYVLTLAPNHEPISRQLTIISLPGNVVIEQLPPAAKEPNSLSSNAAAPLGPHMAQSSNLALTPGSLAPTTPFAIFLGANFPEKPSTDAASPIAPSSVAPLPPAIRTEAPPIPPPSAPNPFAPPHLGILDRPVSDIDDWVVRQIKHYNIRGAQMAVIHGPKLVFCRSYTWAEPDYPIVMPTSSMFVWSVSKLVTYVTLTRLLTNPARFNPKDPNSPTAQDDPENPLKTRFWRFLPHPSDDGEDPYGPNVWWGMLGYGLYKVVNALGKFPFPEGLKTSNPLLYNLTLQDLVRHNVRWSPTTVNPAFNILYDVVGQWTFDDPPQPWSTKPIDYLTDTTMARDIAAQYNQYLWPAQDPKFQPQSGFWTLGPPLDPQPFLAFLLSYGLVTADAAPVRYANADAAIVGMLVEHIVNPGMHPHKTDNTHIVSYPEIVEKEIWRNLGASSDAAQAAISARVQLNDFSQAPPSAACRQHGETPQIQVSGYNMAARVPVQYKLDSPRTEGPFGGWRMPAVDMARILAALDAAGHTGVTLLSKAARNLMWEKVGGERVDDSLPITSGGWRTTSHGYLWHNGRFNGGAALAVYDRGSRIGFVLLYNQGWARMLDPDGHDVVNELGDAHADSLIALLQNVDLPDRFGDSDLFEEVGYRSYQ